MAGFYKKLSKSWRKHNSLLCIGLDPDPQRIPGYLGSQPGNIFSFNREIIDATAAWACAYKPQAAYYNAIGAEQQLADTIDYIRSNYPEHVVILDSKRGDIGATARMYAMEAFERYQADAVTVNPYMGGDTLEPYLEYGDKGVIILCKTSNPGSGDIQDLDIGQGSVYRYVARLAAGQWNKNRNIGLVVGATVAGIVGEVRQEVGEMPLLIPGVGTQGGDLEKVLEVGLNPDSTGLIINVSRAVIFAGEGKEFAGAAADAAEKMCVRINDCRRTAGAVG
jgi:orotidine-5'-phosphate decarboxylase